MAKGLCNAVWVGCRRSRERPQARAEAESCLSGNTRGEIIFAPHPAEWQKANVRIPCRTFAFYFLALRRSSAADLLDKLPFLSPDRISANTAHPPACLPTADRAPLLKAIPRRPAVPISRCICRFGTRRAPPRSYSMHRNNFRHPAPQSLPGGFRQCRSPRRGAGCARHLW